jgi:DNA integrity scanning protein DisA with diadenylate cyclase activity
MNQLKDEVVQMWGKIDKHLDGTANHLDKTAAVQQQQNKQLMEGLASLMPAQSQPQL